MCNFYTVFYIFQLLIVGNTVFQDSYKNELLEEIKEMTEELKRRSTMISNLEEQLEKVKNQDLKCAQAELASLRSQLQQKTEEVETMSTSTVSKMDESARMVDVEASFEDR